MVFDELCFLYEYPSYQTLTQELNFQVLLFFDVSQNYYLTNQGLMSLIHDDEVVQQLALLFVFDV